MSIKLLVYGTLKRGFWNHEIFCSEAISIEAATVRGKLYELPSGIPVLEVPDEDIIAHGSVDILEDVAVQYRLDTNQQKYSEGDGEGWLQIEGELIILPDPENTLPPIDQLEGFVPNGVSLYHRVLVPVKLSDERVTTACCYVSAPITASIMTLRPRLDGVSL